MATTTTPVECPPPGTARRLTRSVTGTRGLIQYCRPPFTLRLWPADQLIPDDWIEAAPSVTARLDATRVEAEIQAPTLQPTEQQRARSRVAPPRPPRAPRVARAARPPRAPSRRPRNPRPARVPREPRTPRPPRARQELKPEERRAWHCIYTFFEDGRLQSVNHSAPTPSELAFVVPGTTGNVAFRSGPPPAFRCPPMDRSPCRSKLAAFVKPLQQLLGWTPPAPPPPRIRPPRPPRVRPLIRPLPGVAPTPAAITPLVTLAFPLPPPGAERVRVVTRRGPFPTPPIFLEETLEMAVADYLGILIPRFQREGGTVLSVTAI